MNDIVNVAALHLPAIGSAFAGGTFGGRFFVGDQPYALIVAPKDIGELAPSQWDTARRPKEIAGATSHNDGAANTEAMLAAGSPLAKWARGLSHDGLDDWYLPSRLEALLIFHELKGLPAFGFERDWYWSSTQYAGDAEYAWCQGFYDGYQGYSHEDFKLRARAVRRVPIR